MKLLFEQLRACGVGVRRHTMDDFYGFCESVGIHVIRSDFKFSFYFCIGNKPFIVLPKYLSGARLAFEAYHELAHHHLSAGTPALYGGDSKDEVQADAVALVCMMPDPSEPYDDSPCGLRLWERRKELKWLYDV